MNIYIFYLHFSIGTESLRYIPDDNEIEVGKQKTGVEIKQKFVTNKLSWKLIELKRGQLALVAIDSTHHILTLHGSNGAVNCKKTLNSICAKLWSSYELNLTAKHISQNDYEEMSNSLKDAFKGIWITTPYERTKMKENIREYVYLVDNRSFYKKHLLNSKLSGARTLKGEIRPIIYLPDNILIDVSTQKLYKNYHDVAKMKLSTIIEKFEKGEERTVTKETVSELNEILKHM